MHGPLNVKEVRITYRIFVGNFYGTRS